MTLFDLVSAAKAQGSHDLHLKPGSSPAIRKAGVVQKLGSNKLSPKDILDMAHALLSPSEMNELNDNGHVDIATELAGQMKIRVNVFKQRHSLSMSLRFIPHTILDIIDLGFEQQVQEDVLRLKNGLFLVTGATNSGKTTTIGSVIKLLAQRNSCHIITIEDPIEFTFPPFTESFITQRQIGRDCVSFSGALTAALRQDPDIIVIGEMRDLATVETALVAAETGHLVISTVHTNSATNSILRLINLFPEEKRAHIRNVLASILQGLVAQILVPSADRTRRHLAYEVLKPMGSIRNHIRENKLAQLENDMEINRKNGCVLMRETLAKLVNDKKVNFEDIPLEFAALMKK